MGRINLFDVVALTSDLRVRGQVGTVVEHLRPDVYEVEFSDDNGRTYAQAPLRSDQLIVLHYTPQAA
jgi:uncharacterized protein DUF4926